MEKLTTTHDFARHYLIDRRWSIIPVIRGAKAPAISWRQYQHRHATEAEIDHWFKVDGLHNLGIITGKISGITVVDVDSLDLLPQLKELGVGSPLVARTGRGVHLIYSYEEKIKTCTTFGGLKGLDVRNDGAYIVAPPSIHPNGHQYRFLLNK